MNFTRPKFPSRLSSGLQKVKQRTKRTLQSSPLTRKTFQSSPLNSIKNFFGRSNPFGGKKYTKKKNKVKKQKKSKKPKSKKN
tara:strand:- start:7 stop:252 length:246 start_codon:yes stop_codon:yes gene_type:complete